MVDFAKKDPSEDQRKIQTTDLIQFQFVFIKYLLQCFWWALQEKYQSKISSCLFSSNKDNKWCIKASYFV